VNVVCVCVWKRERETIDRANNKTATKAICIYIHGYVFTTEWRKKLQSTYHGLASPRRKRARPSISLYRVRGTRTRVLYNTRTRYSISRSVRGEHDRNSINSLARKTEKNWPRKLDRVYVKHHDRSVRAVVTTTTICSLVENYDFRAFTLRRVSRTVITATCKFASRSKLRKNDEHSVRP